MRATVAAAWPAFIRPYEGVCSWMYLDTKLKVTTGIGFLIDSAEAARELAPWYRADGTVASGVNINAEWLRTKQRTDLAPKGGYAFRPYATLHLLDADIDRALMAKTAQFWARLGQTLPRLEEFPADAQLAVLDEAWQNGPGFLDLRDANGAYVWAGTRAALLGQNFAAAADHVPGTGARAGRRRRLFQNAAAVVTLGLDPERLWDADTPHQENEVTPADLAAIGKLIDDKLAALPKPPTADEVAAIVVGKLAEEIANEDDDLIAGIWATDSIPAPDEDPTNPNWQPKSYLRNIYLMARQARDAAKQALAAVKALPRA